MQCVAVYYAVCCCVLCNVLVCIMQCVAVYNAVCVALSHLIVVLFMLFLIVRV